MVSVFLTCNANQFVVMVINFDVCLVVRYSKGVFISLTNPIVVVFIGEYSYLEVFEDDHVRDTVGEGCQGCESILFYYVLFGWSDGDRWLRGVLG